MTAMRKTTRILLGSLAGMLCLGVLAAPASARYTAEEARAKLAANDRAIALAKARIAAAKREERGLAAAVAAIDDRLNVIDGKLVELQGRIAGVSARLTTSEARLARISCA